MNDTAEQGIPARVATFQSAKTLGVSFTSRCLFDKETPKVSARPRKSIPEDLYCPCISELCFRRAV